MQDVQVKKEIPHRLTVDMKKSVSVLGVDSVVAFSPAKITLTLCGGERLYIVGMDLKITAFSKESGVFEAVGKITGASYGGKGFAAKIFK